MERYVPFEPGQYYHVYNRGVNKDKIFFSDGDWTYFQRLLRIRNDAEGHVRPERVRNMALSDLEIQKPLVDIQAYALMPNHFHIMLSEREPGGISTFMKRLLTSYSMYINKKYDRTGPLMCRPFRAKHINSDEYLRWVVSYIHLNPLDLNVPTWQEEGIGDAVKASDFIRTYPFSSYNDYFVEERDETAVINKESLPIFISDLEDINTMLNTHQSNLV